MGLFAKKKDRKKGSAPNNVDDGAVRPVDVVEEAVSEKGSLADQNEQLIGLNQKIIDQNQAMLLQYQEMLERSSSQYQAVLDMNVALQNKLNALVDDDDSTDDGSENASITNPVSASKHAPRLASPRTSVLVATSTSAKDKAVAAVEQVQFFLPQRLCYQCSDGNARGAVPVDEPNVILYHEVYGSKDEGDESQDLKMLTGKKKRESVATTAETDSDCSNTAQE